MRTICAAAIAAFTVVTGVAHAADPAKPMGYYVGAEYGNAQSSNEVPGWIGPIPVDKTTGGWTVYAGIRPARYFGAELDYMDFGNAKVFNLRQDTTPTPNDITYLASAKNNAIAGYLMAYLPIAKSRWDLFAKAGYASFSTKTYSEGVYPNICVGQPCTLIDAASMSYRHQQSDFAYGFGAQYRLGSLGIRAEYQKITTDWIAPRLISVGVYWNF